MSKTHQLSSDFWVDDYTSNLDPIEKLLFLYLITNPDANIAGVYQLPIKSIAADTGINRDMIYKILARFEKERKILFRDGWVCVKNRSKYNKQDNANIRIGIESILKTAPAFIIEFIELETVTIPSTNVHINIDIDKGINTDKNINALSEEKKLEGDFSSIITELIIAYSNKNPVQGSSVGVITAGRKAFLVRLKQGTTYSQILEFIQSAPNECLPWEIFPKGGKKSVHSIGPSKEFESHRDYSPKK